MFRRSVAPIQTQHCQIHIPYDTSFTQSTQSAAISPCFDLSSSLSSVGVYIPHDSPPLSLLQVYHVCCGNPGITNNTEEMIQVRSPGNSDEREMQDTQTSTKCCHNSLRLRFSRQQRLLRGEKKKSNF